MMRNSKLAAFVLVTLARVRVRVSLSMDQQLPASTITDVTLFAYFLEVKMEGCFCCRWIHI